MFIYFYVDCRNVDPNKQKKGQGVHRLYSNEDDSDNEDGTYNGNSTQQQ